MLHLACSASDTAALASAISASSARTVSMASASFCRAGVRAGAASATSGSGPDGTSDRGAAWVRRHGASASSGVMATGPGHQILSLFAFGNSISSMRLRSAASMPRGSRRTA